MQFTSFVTFALAAMASVAFAEKTVTVYACEATSSVVPVATSSVVSVPGVASSTASVVTVATSIASTGVVTAPTSTGSPIAFATGAASMNGVSGSALGLIVAGGVALLF
jgi:hypothetical protein